MMNYVEGYSGFGTRLLDGDAFLRLFLLGRLVGGSVVGPWSKSASTMSHAGEKSSTDTVYELAKTRLWSQ